MFVHGTPNDAKRDCAIFNMSSSISIPYTLAGSKPTFIAAANKLPAPHHGSRIVPFVLSNFSNIFIDNSGGVKN